MAGHLGCPRHRHHLHRDSDQQRTGPHCMKASEFSEPLQEAAMRISGRPLLGLAAGALAAISLIGCSPLGPQSALAPSGGESCTVARVVDGDTIWADCGQGKADKIRMIGLDTPETKDPAEVSSAMGPRRPSARTSCSTVSTSPSSPTPPRIRRTSTAGSSSTSSCPTAACTKSG